MLQTICFVMVSICFEYYNISIFIHFIQPLLLKGTENSKFIRY